MQQNSEADRFIKTLRILFKSKMLEFRSLWKSPKLIVEILKTMLLLNLLDLASTSKKFWQHKKNVWNRWEPIW